MPFREKSAWMMIAALSLAGAGYAAIVVQLSMTLERLAPPLIPMLVVFMIALAVLAAGSHILISVLAPKDATAPEDERDRTIAARAGARSGYVFATGVTLALGHYLMARDGDVLFYAVFAAWTLAQVSEYAFQIALYRQAS